ncbi:hypothetical protein [Tumebacillus permanentifrigoris]|uniref:Uncharacterized protein n=1 Tax=Tumebacillus permanentifrigoris TaxID=378543 RepID=A0A316D638_9BACL|nr:hypothetical protein [Tumebacillus permanentifrigoris]PWK10200.1 hypothetical protein C7459_11221 [Tumebacillus permanentifrigoris]
MTERYRAVLEHHDETGQAVGDLLNGILHRERLNRRARRALMSPYDPRRGIVAKENGPDAVTSSPLVEQLEICLQQL